MIVADSLENIDFVMSMFLPSDVHQHVADRDQMATMLRYTTKPVFYVTTEFAGCVHVVGMTESFVGGADSLWRKPLAACYTNVTTGLVHNQETLQKPLFLAGKGLPFAYVPSAQGGVTAPVTPVGALIVS